MPVFHPGSDGLTQASGRKVAIVIFHGPGIIRTYRVRNSRVRPLLRKVSDLGEPNKKGRVSILRC